MRYKAGDIVKNKDSGQVGEVTYTYNDRVFYRVEGDFMMSSDMYLRWAEISREDTPW